MAVAGFYDVLMPPVPQEKGELRTFIHKPGPLGRAAIVRNLTDPVLLDKARQLQADVYRVTCMRAIKAYDLYRRAGRCQRFKQVHVEAADDFRRCTGYGGFKVDSQGMATLDAKYNTHTVPKCLFLHLCQLSPLSTLLRTAYTLTPNSRRAALRETFLSVEGLRLPMIRAQGT